MSVRNFSRVFHQAYGISPINYVIQLRIQHAYELLHTMDISVSEVAYLCGFQDSSYFTRQFKHASGLTPKEYRNFLVASDRYNKFSIDKKINRIRIISYYLLRT